MQIDWTAERCCCFDDDGDQLQLALMVGDVQVGGVLMDDTSDESWEVVMSMAAAFTGETH